MRKILLSVVGFALIAITALAQENPYLGVGRSFVGGGLSVNISDNENEGGNFTNQRTSRNNSFSLSPTYGKFFNDRWAYGVSFTVGFANNEQTTSGNDFIDRSVQESTTVGLTPFLRRFLPITERFGAYLQPQISYQYNSGIIEQDFRVNNDPINDQLRTFDTRNHLISAGMQGGFYYFITQRFSVETNLLSLDFTYSSNNRERTDASAQPGENTQLSSTAARINLVNQLSLDRILILNYYF